MAPAFQIVRPLKNVMNTPDEPPFTLTPRVPALVAEIGEAGRSGAWLSAENCIISPLDPLRE